MATPENGFNLTKLLYRNQYDYNESQLSSTLEVRSMLYIFLYLIAIIAANLSVAYFGAASTIINAFLFIGLDFTVRDALHERWHRKHLTRNMILLIGAGSLLSWVLNKDTGPVALASFVAFALSGLVDTVVYQLLNRYPKLVKINGSNLFSSAADSIAFPTIAFGGFLPSVVLGQFAAKVIGGYVWSLLLRSTVWKEQHSGEKL